MRRADHRVVKPLLTALFAPARRQSIRDDLIELGDGRRVQLAPVTPQDAPAERSFVGALSLNSRYRRFHFGLRELSPEQSRAMTEIDQHHHVAFVARPEGDSPIVADARYVRASDSAAQSWRAAHAQRRRRDRGARRVRVRHERRRCAKLRTRLGGLKTAPLVLM